jgi:protein disulfide-isomerase
MGLERFQHKKDVEIVWHSFQLDPSLETNAEVDIYDYLAERKGMSRDQSREMHLRVARMASEVGLQFDFDKVVVSNSFNGHRLIQLAKSEGKADIAEEQLFKAHFSDGKNIDDQRELVEIGNAIGLDEKQVADMLSSDAFAGNVQQDEMAARYLGIRAVPFYLFDNKLGASGAQSPEVFLQTLQHAWHESKSKTGR